MRQPSSSRFSASVLTAAILVMPLALQAQSLSEFHDLSPEEKRAYWDSMSEQERQAKREQWRAERDAMSNEERAAMHARHIPLDNMPRPQLKPLELGQRLGIKVIGRSGHGRRGVGG